MQQRDITELFFELVRMGIGTGKGLSYTPTTEDWEKMYELANKQAVLGVAFSGIEKLPAEQRPPKDILLKWYNISLIIAKQNEKLNRQAVAISRKFKEEGFDNAIIKGQGIAALYDEPARRTAGDIDIWLDGGRKKIMDYVKRFIPSPRPNYHHVDFPVIKGVSVEIHFMPSWMFNFFTDRKLQRYFALQQKEQFNNKIMLGNEGEIPVPTLAFNRIFILLHIYRHLFQEGIGLRQLLDYHYVLKQGFTKEEQAVTIAQMKEFGVLRFTGAVMYILKEIFGLEDKYHIVEPREKEGAELLNEVMRMGNFGKYAPEFNIQQNGTLLQRALSRTKFNLSKISRYPGEAFWAPFFRVWHFFWMKMNK